MSDGMLTAVELADRLALSTSTILDWFEAGRLPVLQARAGGALP